MLTTDHRQTLSFTVFGEPAPAGSKRGFTIKKPDGSVGVRMEHANKKSAPWMGAVRYAALTAMEEPGLLPGALEVHVTFYRPRLKGHFGKRGLKPSAPAAPDTWYDLDKLLRALFDAMQGIVYRNDAQICEVRASKRYGEPARAEVRVMEYQPTFTFHLASFQ